jgi:hypothetical protein
MKITDARIGKLCSRDAEDRQYNNSVADAYI